ncbi:MAG TPA: hypothetical protein VNJ04_04045 [Gemmatimonadaceae bacterium]|nr:hypothetical protein [Gemmatimonadaceae bacterium]
MNGSIDTVGRGTMTSTTALALTPRVDDEPTLARLEQARVLLAEVQDIGHAKVIHDFGKAALTYAQAHKSGSEIVVRARAIVLEALWILGRLLATTERARGGQPYQRSSTGSSSAPVATLADLGLDKKISSRARQVYRLPEDLFRRVRDGRMTLERALWRVKDKAAHERFLDYVGRDGELSRNRDLRVCSVTELFSDWRADAVFTEVLARRQLHQLSAMAAACADVRCVAVRMELGCLDLPEVLTRLSAHLNYRRTLIYDKRAVLLFWRDDEQFCAAMRARTMRSYVARPSWTEYLVYRVTDPGDIVVDPFLRSEAVWTAVEAGRRFIGCSTDAAAVADLREKIKAQDDARAEVGRQRKSIREEVR